MGRFIMALALAALVATSGCAASNTGKLTQGALVVTGGMVAGIGLAENITAGLPSFGNSGNDPRTNNAAAFMIAGAIVAAAAVVVGIVDRDPSPTEP